MSTVVCSLFCIYLSIPLHLYSLYHSRWSITYSPDQTSASVYPELGSCENVFFSPGSITLLHTLSIGTFRVTYHFFLPLGTWYRYRVSYTGFWDSADTLMHLPGSWVVIQGFDAQWDCDHCHQWVALCSDSVVYDQDQLREPDLTRPPESTPVILQLLGLLSLLAFT